MAALLPTETRTYTAKDTLAHRQDSETVRTLVGIDSDPTLKGMFETSFDTAKELQGIKTNGGSNEAIWEAGRSKKVGAFSHVDAEATKLRFGAGRAEMDGSNKVKVETGDLTGGDKAAVEAHARNGEELVDRISTVIDVVGVLSDMHAGASLSDTLRKRDITGSWIDLKKDALDTIMTTPAIQAILPEIGAIAITDPNKARSIIENTLANDPKLAAKLTERMRILSQRAQSLKEVEVDTELEGAKDAKKDAEAKLSEIPENVAKVLDDNGITLDTAYKDHIKTLVSRGVKPETILAAMNRDLLADAGYQNLINLQKAKLAYEAAFNIFSNTDPKKVHTDVVDKRKAAADEAEKVVEALQVEVAKMSPDEQTARIAYINMVNELTNFKRDGNVYMGEIASQLADGLKAKNSLAKAENTIKARESAGKPVAAQSRQERLRQEADILAEMEDVVSEAVIDVLEGRHREMNQLDIKRVAEETKKAEEAGDKQKVDLLRKVTKVKQERWISYDKNKGKTVNRTRIGEDMKVLIYEGEDGVKRLIQRDIRAGGLTIDGVVIADTDDFTALTPEQQKKITELTEQVHASEGDSYKRKLFGDYMEAQTLTERVVGKVLANRVNLVGSLKDLSLKDYEWELLNKNFGSLVDSALDQSPNARKVIEEMTKQGIKLTSKTKWVLAILAMMGLIVALPLGAGTVMGGAGVIKGARELTKKR